MTSLACTRDKAPAHPAISEHLAGRIRREFTTRWDTLWSGRSLLHGRDAGPDAVRLNGNDYLSLTGHQDIVQAQTLAIKTDAEFVIQSGVFLLDEHPDVPASAVMLPIGQRTSSEKQREAFCEEFGGADRHHRLVGRDVEGGVDDVAVEQHVQVLVERDARHELLGAFLAFRVAIHQIRLVIAQQQGELHQFLHDVHHAIVVRRRLHSTFVVELLPLVVVEKPTALAVAAHPTVPWLLAGAEAPHPAMILIPSAYRLSMQATGMPWRKIIIGWNWCWWRMKNSDRR